jgi:hypothetical protein
MQRFRPLPGGTSGFKAQILDCVAGADQGALSLFDCDGAPDRPGFLHQEHQQGHARNVT